MAAAADSGDAKSDCSTAVSNGASAAAGNDSGREELKSFLSQFDAPNSSKLFDMFCGPEFGAIRIEDLHQLDDSEWITVQSRLGKLPAKRLREALKELKTRSAVDTKSSAQHVTVGSGGTLTAGAVGPNSQSFVTTNIYSTAAADPKLSRKAVHT